jgi:hypothetical protein
MGTLVASRLVPVEPRTRRLVLGGVGGGAVTGRPVAQSRALADGLVAYDAASITNPVARAFRSLAESTGADRHALAAVLRADPW